MELKLIEATTDEELIVYEKQGEYYCVECKKPFKDYSQDDELVIRCQLRYDNDYRNVLGYDGDHCYELYHIECSEDHTEEKHCFGHEMVLDHANGGWILR